MPPASTPEPAVRRQERRPIDWTLAYALLAAVGGATLLAMAATPVAALVGDGPPAFASALHGVTATAHVVLGTISLYLAYLLYVGRLQAHRDLRIVATLQSFLALVTILFGNWVYLHYRAPGGARTYLLETAPVVHEVFFEFKEYVSLFTFPLVTAAAFILWRERDALRGDVLLRQAVAALLGLSWVFLMIAFGLGAAITRIRSV